MLYPELLNCPPNTLAMSGRDVPSDPAWLDVLHTNAAGPPFTGYAHTCTSKMPLPLPTPRSSAQPETVNGCVLPITAPYCGPSICITGSDAVGPMNTSMGAE